MTSGSRGERGRLVGGCYRVFPPPQGWHGALCVLWVCVSAELAGRKEGERKPMGFPWIEAHS